MADGSGSGGKRNYDLELQIAISEGRYYDVESLLTEGAKLNGTEDHRYNPLYSAILKSRSQEKIVKTLLDQGARVDTYVRFPGERGFAKIMTTAAEFGTVPIMKMILAKYPEMISFKEGEEGRRQYSLLDLAAAKQNTEMVDFLLSQGVKPIPREEAPEKSLAEWREEYYKTLIESLKGGRRLLKKRSATRSKSTKRRNSRRIKHHTKRIR